MLSGSALVKAVHGTLMKLTPGMCNMRLTKPQNVLLSVCLFDKNTFAQRKNTVILALGDSKKVFGPPYVLKCASLAIHYYSAAFLFSIKIYTFYTNIEV